MITVIDGLPENVVGFEAKGEVRSEDYHEVLEPAIDAAAAANDKIGMLYVLGDEFEGYSGGAMWQDAKVGFGHWTSFSKIALVTDKSSYADGVKAFGWLLPGEVRTFPVADLDVAKDWVSSAS